jgi:hypothetical protein
VDCACKLDASKMANVASRSIDFIGNALACGIADDQRHDQMIASGKLRIARNPVPVNFVLWFATARMLLR